MDLWRHLFSTLQGRRWAPLPAFADDLRVILERGPLARRILAATGETPTPASITRTYQKLAQVLASGGVFDGHA
jgi:hypothetical protein